MPQRLKHLRLKDYPIAVTLDRREDGVAELRVYDLDTDEPRLIKIKFLPEPTNKGARDVFSKWVGAHYPRILS